MKSTFTIKATVIAICFLVSTTLSASGKCPRYECGDGTCVPFPSWCPYLSKFKSFEGECRGYTCSDGTCVPKSFWCPMVSKVINKLSQSPCPYRCPDGSCAQWASECPSEKKLSQSPCPYRCPDGSCAESASECPSEFSVMGSDFYCPHKCSETGICVLHESMCTLVSDFMRDIVEEDKKEFDHESELSFCPRFSVTCHGICVPGNSCKSVERILNPPKENNRLSCPPFMTPCWNGTCEMRGGCGLTSNGLEPVENREKNLKIYCPYGMIPCGDHCEMRGGCALFKEPETLPKNGENNLKIVCPRGMIPCGDHCEIWGGCALFKKPERLPKNGEKNLKIVCPKGMIPCGDHCEIWGGCAGVANPELKAKSKNIALEILDELLA